MGGAQRQTDAVFEGPVMKAADAAAYLQICPRTLRRLAKAGKIPRYNIRGDGVPGRPMWRYRREDLDAYLLSTQSDPLRRQRRPAPVKQPD